MAKKYEEFIVRWCFKASWSFLEAALILNKINPETSTFQPDRKGSDKVSALYFWLVKEHRKAALITIDDIDPPRCTLGDIIRQIREHKQSHSEEVVKIWESIRYKKNNGWILSKMSWAIYEKAIELILQQHPNITKEQLAQSLDELPRCYLFPNNEQLMSYGKSTLLRKLRGVTKGKAGRPKNGSLITVDMSLIAKQITLK